MFDLLEQIFSMSKMFKLSAASLKPITTFTLNSEAMNIIKLPGLDIFKGKIAIFLMKISFLSNCKCYVMACIKRLFSMY